MSKLILTAGAKQDLADIKAYIAGSLKNSEAALRVVGTVTKELRALLHFPQMGRIVESGQNRAGYRVLVCGNYLAFYRIKANTIYVDRILYGRRDYLPILFGEEPKQDES